MLMTSSVGDSQWVGRLGVQDVISAGVAVPVVGDEEHRLVPPVEHQNHQHVPQLVTGTQVVQLACGWTWTWTWTQTHTHTLLLTFKSQTK